MPGNIAPQNTNPQPPVPPQDADTGFLSHLTSPRSRKQLGLFIAGASFFALSSVMTRRALLRRHKATVPGFYQLSNRTVGSANGPLEAVEALRLASINVASGAMMLTGGALWATDISSMDDLRRKVRGWLGVDGTGMSEREAEENLEDWLATVLARKDEKERINKDAKRRRNDGVREGNG